MTVAEHEMRSLRLTPLVGAGTEKRQVPGADMKEAVEHGGF